MAHIFSSERGKIPQKTPRMPGKTPRGSNLLELQGQADVGPGPQRLSALQSAAEPVQRMEEEELLQGKAQGASLTGEPVQRMEEEEPLQGKAQGGSLTSEPVQTKKDTGSAQGLPSNLKAGIENLSGHSLDDVKVHYNSSRPAQLNAHAYAQGKNIHVASGQEKHLPHEAWHVVQQAQGRVKPTMSVGGQQINDDVQLESEADRMGAQALSAGPAKVPD